MSRLRGPSVKQIVILFVAGVILAPGLCLAAFAISRSSGPPPQLVIALAVVSVVCVVACGVLIVILIITSLRDGYWQRDGDGDGL